MPRRPGPAEWEMLLAEYKQSGLTQKEFVAKHDLALGTFQFWLYKQSKRKSALDSNSRAAFLPVQVVASPAPKARLGGAVEVALEGGPTIRFTVGTDPRYVALLARALR
ncbi:MAG: IS66 family insertion sequence element accessory protein TnpA [Myxococcaceae bacterium]